MSSFYTSFKRIFSVLVLSFVLTLLATNQVWATHLRAGDITVERIGARTYRIFLKVYTNTKDTDVLFSHGGTGVLDYGDGSSEFVEENPGAIRTELGPNINYVEVIFIHEYSGNKSFTISYQETNRNRGVLNMTNSVETPFYIETQITTDPYFGNDDSPVLIVPPIDQGCVGVAWFHNPGAYDPDRGDSLSYNLVVPFMDRATTVSGYRSPADAGFYLDYSHGSENKLNKPSFAIDPITGTITWDSPGAQGEYNIAFVVVEWRKVDGIWRKLGFVRRDMQIIITDCANQRPDLIIPKDICVEVGQPIHEKIIGTDPDIGDKVKIEAFSQLLSISNATAKFTTKPGFNLAPDTAKFDWTPGCGDVNPQPYYIVFKVSDESIPKLVTFKTWSIKVVAPAPIWKDAALSAPAKSASLEWESYKCSDAEKMQVWRRIDKVNASIDTCVTGMPDLGYTLIAEVPLKDGNNNPVTKYIDKGLAPGAFYCYRLVAIYPLDKGGSESHVSKDTCIGPFDIDAPIITKVSIDSTSETKGKISVEWVVKPTTIATKYQAYRGIGFTGAFSPTPVYTGTDLNFIDNLLDTENEIYHYRIISYDVGNAVVDTSATASSVRLETREQVGKITLTWSASVPWSNSVVGQPHEVFRGPEGSKEGDLLSIGFVDVTTDGFQFVDNGPLDDTKKYLYRVKALGSYGTNPNPPADAAVIPNPLVNYSQTILAQPGDSIPPCKPDFPLTLNKVDCKDKLNDTPCLNNIFINTLTWNDPDVECKKDILGYKIFYAVSTKAEFIELKTGPNKDRELIIKGTSYDDTLDISYARCYKIAAIDRSGNISELTDKVCFDNCIHYELPNVFTPNNDKCNDLFSAYDPRNNGGEANSICRNLSEDLLRQRCPRYVKSVVFRVYNRWGNEVYSYNGSSDDDENTIFIDWNGKANNGTTVSTGVYYYIAEVTFDVVDPSKKTKIYKGWVHILYDTIYPETQ